MTVLELMRSFEHMASDKKYKIEVRHNPGDGSSKKVHRGEIKDEIHMRPSVRNAEIWKWFISEKDRTIVVIVRSIAETNDTTINPLGTITRP